MEDDRSLSNGGDVAAGGWSQRNVRLLKAAVYIMGVLIVIGAMALVAGIVVKAGRGGRRAAALSHLDVSAPAGAKVISSRLNGDRLVIDLATPGGGEVVIVDLRKGAVTARVRIRPVAP